MDTPLVDLDYLTVSTDSCHRISICWKCKGDGTKMVRRRVNADGRKQLILVSCGTCDGQGTPKSLKKSELIKPSVRPFKLKDWNPTGPRTGGIPFRNGLWDLESISLEDLPGVNEMLCSLSGFWGIYQFIDGHKFTTDDVCTAGFTIQVVQEDALPVKRYMDLGTGLGSVLMMVTWNLFDKLEHIGAIEAQSKHIELVQRSIRLNGIKELIDIHHGDLRSLDQITKLKNHLNSFDLITGTPPYFLPREGVFSNISGIHHDLLKYQAVVCVHLN